MKLKKILTSKGLVSFEKNWTTQHNCVDGKPMAETYNVRLNGKFMFKLRVTYKGTQGLEFESFQKEHLQLRSNRCWDTGTNRHCKS